MSNQVYANSLQKFYPCPGVDTYATALTAVAQGATVTIPYEAPVVIQAANQVSLAAGVCTFLEEGIYSINAKIAFQDSADASGVDPDMRFYLELVSGGFAADGLKLCDSWARWVPPGGSPAVGSTIKVATLTYVGYFAKGSTLACKATNTNASSPAKTTNILAGDSGLIICKLI